MLFLFPPDIRTKYQEYASYVNADKRNIIHTSIQTQRLKPKEVCLEFTKEKFKIKNDICLTKVQKAHCCLKLATMTFENDLLMISAAISN